MEPIHLCTSDTETATIPDPDCPRADLHTPCPPGYLSWFDWAGSRYAKGSKQSRCPSCGRYLVWSPVPARTNKPSGARRVR